MSDGSDGQRSPFDLFGPARAVGDAGEVQGPELSELMRQEADAAQAADPVADAADVPDTDASADVRAPAAPERRAPAPAPAPQPVDDPPRAGPAADAIDATPAPAAPAAPVAPAAPAPWPEGRERSAPAPAAAPASAGSTPTGAARPEPAATVFEPGVADPAPRAAPPRAEGARLHVLRMLLIGNIAMMLVMLVLPHPLEPRTTAPGSELAGPAAGARNAAQRVPTTADPFVAPARLQGLGLPDDARYERALVLALDGDFDAACAELQGLLDAAPDLNPAVARLVHAHLAYYLRKAGRLGEALEHERLARQEADRAALPEELLREARAAQARGDGAAMRRAYAQFLLQEGQLSPDLRALVRESLLEVGDSYRVQAEAGETGAEARGR